jgi:hypothetical protein
VSANERLLAALDEQRDYVCAETLAVTLTAGAPARGATTATARVDGVDVTLGLERSS